MCFIILLFILNSYADEGIDVSGLMGAEVIIDPYGNSDYDTSWQHESEAVAFSYDVIPSTKIDMYEGNACLEKFGCDEGNGYKESESEKDMTFIKPYTPLIFRPFTFNDIFD